MVRIVYSEKHKLHIDPRGYHPENPERLERAFKALMDAPFNKYLKVVNPPSPKEDLLFLVHNEYYVNYILEESRKGFHYIDFDTYVTEYTYELAASFFTASFESAAEALNTKEFIVIMPRPGGHHAGVNGVAFGAPTLGFCVFNYAAAAAKSLLLKGYKTLIIDFDAHHGNGTQEIFWNEGRVVHIDIHEEGIYPGSGDVRDLGGVNAEGTKINIPVVRGAGDETYLWTLANVIDKVVEVFQPNALVVSAGFDAHSGDPLTGLNVSDETYRAFGAYFNKLAYSGVKAVISVVEGGYGKGLISGLVNYVEALLSGQFIKPETAGKPLIREGALRDLKTLLSRYWGIELQV